MQKLESDAAVAKPVEELPAVKDVIVEIDAPNNMKLEEGEASSANYDLSASVMWSDVEDLKDIWLCDVTIISRIRIFTHRGVV